MDKFHDYEAPLLHIHTKRRVPSAIIRSCSYPHRHLTICTQRAISAGLQLYSNGVMIMDSCEELLPEYFGFVKGLVDSADISLNISREMLQQNRQLRAIANGLKKKIKSET